MAYPWPEVFDILGEGLAPVTAIDALTRLKRFTRTHGFQKRVEVDSGPEFVWKELDCGAYRTMPDWISAGPARSPK